MRAPFAASGSHNPPLYPSAPADYDHALAFCAVAAWVVARADLIRKTGGVAESHRCLAALAIHRIGCANATLDADAVWLDE
jgi:hypothetical protein